MKILAFETSCDDTSVAIFENNKLLAMATESQIKIHNKTGGVVPEVAAREHANSIFLVLENVLEKTKLNLKDFDYIACTTSPGLLPSLLTGVSVASTISTVLKIPIVPINHIKAHIFSNFLERKEDEITFPLVCLTVSGGHNDIYFMKSMWEIEKLGETGDDAGGEAFDKIAKMMDLGYPGGPIISKLASEYEKENKSGRVEKKEREGGNKRKKELKVTSCKLQGGKKAEKKQELGTINYELGTKLFPRVWLVKREFNFSFSGLKSAVKREIDRRIKEKGALSIEDKKEISFEAEEAIGEVLSWKLAYAAEKYNTKNIMLAGGVSANNKLKNMISDIAKKKLLNFIYPKSIIYSMDNAAMIGILAYYKIKYKKFEKFVGALEL